MVTKKTAKPKEKLRVQKETVKKLGDKHASLSDDDLKQVAGGTAHSCQSASGQGVKNQTR